MADRRRELSRRQAVRLASAGLRQALSEVTASQRTALRGMGFVPRPILTAKDPYGGAAAWASSPVTFRTTPEGRLVTVHPRSTARHEVAHLVGKAQTGRYTGHMAMRAVRAESSAVGLRQASMVPPGRVTAMLSRRARRVSKLAPAGSSSTGSLVRGFSTRHLRQLAMAGSPEQRRVAREQMRRLGQRMRKRGIDF